MTSPDALADFVATVERLRARHRLPALAAAVVSSTHVDVAATGHRRLRGPRDVTVDDRFHLGSNGKALTALLAARLVEEGRLAWDATLPALFPALAPAMHPAWREVTLRDLLLHVAGLPADPGAEAWQALESPPRARRLALVTNVLERPPAGRRGDFAYANLGYIVAGAAIEQAANAPFEPLLVSRVLAPLGVTTAGFGAAGTAGEDDQPMGHRARWLLWRTSVPPGPEADNPPVYSPAGRVHVSVRDYARVVQATLRLMRGEDGLVRAATMRAMLDATAPEADGARYTTAGWLATERDWSGGTAYTHAGSNTLHYAVAWIAPARDRAVLALTNQGGARAPLALDEVVSALVSA